MPTAHTCARGREHDHLIRGGAPLDEIRDRVTVLQRVERPFEVNREE